jgi:hypothetical protein
MAATSDSQLAFAAPRVHIINAPRTNLAEAAVRCLKLVPPVGNAVEKTVFVLGDRHLDALKAGVESHKDIRVCAVDPSEPPTLDALDGNCMVVDLAGAMPPPWLRDLVRDSPSSTGTVLVLTLPNAAARTVDWARVWMHCQHRWGGDGTPWQTWMST